MSLSIHILSVDAACMKYNTIGDYFGTENARVVLVADMQDWKKELLVAIHEIVEQSLCFDRGIDEKNITKFDKKFEEGNTTNDEPGDQPDAPYYKEHQFATKIEKMLCEELGMTWEEYDNVVTETFNNTFSKKEE